MMSLLQRIERLEKALGLLDEPEMEYSGQHPRLSTFLPSGERGYFTRVCKKLRELTDWDFRGFWYGDVYYVLKEARRRGYLKISEEDLDLWDTLRPVGMRLYVVYTAEMQTDKDKDEVPY